MSRSLIRVVLIGVLMCLVGTATFAQTTSSTLTENKKFEVISAGLYEKLITLGLAEQLKSIGLETERDGAGEIAPQVLSRHLFDAECRQFFSSQVCPALPRVPAN